MLLSVHVVPRSSTSAVVGLLADGSLKVRLTASPVDGEANKALCKLLAQHFGTNTSNITIKRGHTSKNKIVEILG
jgi:uncharacterized protein (TIGR00251 family)